MSVMYMWTLFSHFSSGHGLLAKYMVLYVGTDDKILLLYYNLRSHYRVITLRAHPPAGRFSNDRVREVKR